MSLKQSEAIVLRTYPLREADLLVTLFTRAEGKVKGIARAAKKSKRRFGGALEPLTWVRAYYEDREGQELARLDSCDILELPLWSTSRKCLMSCCRTGKRTTRSFGWRFPCCISCAQVRFGCR